MRGLFQRFSAIAIAITLVTGCASWTRCSERIGTAGDVLLSPTGHDVADGAAAGLWLAVQLGCVTRETFKAAPPAPGVIPVPPKSLWRRPAPPAPAEQPGPWCTPPCRWPTPPAPAEHD